MIRPGNAAFELLNQPSIEILVTATQNERLVITPRNITYNQKYTNTTQGQIQDFSIEGVQTCTQQLDTACTPRTSLTSLTTEEIKFSFLMSPQVKIQNILYFQNLNHFKSWFWFYRTVTDKICGNPARGLATEDHIAYKKQLFLLSQCKALIFALT